MILDRRPSLISRSLRRKIIEELKEAEFLYGWEAKDIIAHFAYLVPEDRRFSLADIEAVVIQLDLGYIDVNPILIELKYTNHVLEERFRRSNILVRLLGLPWPYRTFFMLRTARKQHRTKVSELEFEPEPERHDISQRLADLRTQLKDPNQRSFLDETLKCLRVHAHRAAIVMGWNLAFDHLRQWVFRHHLSQFNTELTTRWMKKSKNYDPVTNYENFPKGEYLVLDVCEKAKLIGGHERDILFEGLRSRNRYAHPTPAVATPAIAAGFIENLLVHVVLNRKFTW